MLNHQKRKTQQQNAGSAPKSKASISEVSSQDKAADEDMASARAFAIFL